MIIMPRRRIEFLGKEKALYEWVLGFFIIIFGLLVLCSYLPAPEGGALFPMPKTLRNALTVVIFVIGGILLAIWGEQASHDPIKSVSMGLGTVGFSILLILFYNTYGLILGTVFFPMGLYLFVHGLLELIKE